MEVYRITHERFAADLSGQGARIYGGRWNSPGVSMLYTSSSVSLCLLELACNSGGLRMLHNLAITCIQIDPKVRINNIKVNELPLHWSEFPATSNSQKFGGHWIAHQHQLVLKVPSAVVREEFNYLLNMTFPGFEKFVKVKWTKPFTFDQRLIPA